MEWRHKPGQDGGTRVELHFGCGGSHNLRDRDDLPHVVVGIYSSVRLLHDPSRRSAGQNRFRVCRPLTTDETADGEVSS